MRQTPNAIMLFAAGLGTRMGGLTSKCPKPLLPVAGKPLIDHALEVIGAARIGKVVANAHYLAGMISDHLAETNVQISLEPDRLLDTGGGLRNALPMLGSDPVFTLNSDAIWVGENPLLALRRAWDPDRMDALLLMVERENAMAHPGLGDFYLQGDGRLKRGPGLVYPGAQIMKTADLPDFPEDVFSLNKVWDRMQECGRLFGVVYSGRWCDVGSPEGIARAEALLRTAKDV